MSHEQTTSSYKTKIDNLSVAMRSLGTGELAELRRMSDSDPGCATFWQLATECGFIDDVNQIQVWMRIVKIMAILTPRGDRASAPFVQNSSQRLGTVLCDGGDPKWVAGSRPLLSETRLMRFLSAPRADALERIARMLAANSKSENGFDCAAIANLLLCPSNKKILREIARSYYRRLDYPVLESKQKEPA